MPHRFACSSVFHSSLSPFFSPRFPSPLLHFLRSPSLSFSIYLCLFIYLSASFSHAFNPLSYSFLLFPLVTYLYKKLPLSVFISLLYPLPLTPSPPWPLPYPFPFYLLSCLIASLLCRPHIEISEKRFTKKSKLWKTKIH